MRVYMLMFVCVRVYCVSYQLCGYPSLIKLYCHCSGESFVFKSKFAGWEGVLKEDYSVVKGEKKTTERKAPKVADIVNVTTLSYHT